MKRPTVGVKEWRGGVKGVDSSFGKLAKGEGRERGRGLRDLASRKVGRLVGESGKAVETRNGGEKYEPNGEMR